MPERTWIDDDFQAFRASFLSALTPNIPLQDNLRAVMMAALWKLKRYSGARVALHFFVNPSYQELHALVCGASEQTADIDRFERQRRSQARDLKPSPDLPRYYTFDDSSDAKIQRAEKLFLEEDEEYRTVLRGDLLRVLQRLAENFPEEFGKLTPRAEDVVIILPLRSRSYYPRLGYLLLWSPGQELRETAEKTREKEIRCIFQTRIRQLLVRLFTNYYRMEQDTYLPSYYQPGLKKVMLLCAQIRDFDRIWSNIALHGGLETKEKKGECRLRLLDQFGQITASAVEENRGRIDQNWGNGLLAVFGEYPGTPDGSPRTSAKQALSAASQMIHRFGEYADKWMAEHFHSADFHEYSTTLNITPSIVVAIDWAPVLFDYFGSVDHRVFMSVGERVNFVKDLASVAGHVRAKTDYDDSTGTNIVLNEDYRGAPILLSASAHAHSKEVVSGVTEQIITLPGRSDRTAVYQVFRENLALRSVGRSVSG